VTDGQTDGRTDGDYFYSPLPGTIKHQLHIKTLIKGYYKPIIAYGNDTYFTQTQIWHITINLLSHMTQTFLFHTDTIMAYYYKPIIAVQSEPAH